MLLLSEPGFNPWLGNQDPASCTARPKKKKIECIKLVYSQPSIVCSGHSLTSGAFLSSPSLPLPPFWKTSEAQVNEINIRHPLLGISPKRKDLMREYLEILSKMRFGLCQNLTMLFLPCPITHFLCVLFVFCFLIVLSNYQVSGTALKNSRYGTSLVIQWVRLHSPNAGAQV